MNAPLDFPIFATRRLPAWALGLSLATHLVVLAGPFLQRQATTDLPPLNVSFRLPAMLAPAAKQAAPLVPPALAGAARATPSERKPLPVPVLAVARPLSESAASTPTVPLPALATAPSSTPSAERGLTSLARAGETSPAVEAADAAAMAGYIRLLGDLLAQRQQYPRLAAVRGWEGEVRLRLQVARKGAIIAVHIVHSSGFDVLDQHAVQLVQSATLPPPPAAQSPNDASPDFLIDIPIHYALKRS